MSFALVALGSNLGASRQLIQEAVEKLRALPSSRSIHASNHFISAPVGGPINQSPYINAAALLETSLAPEALLEACIEIENALGRVREAHWGPRTIDLDLILYDELVIASPELTIPHPRMSFRQFVLAPAMEVASEMLHPVLGATVEELYEHLQTADHCVAIAGCPGSSPLRMAIDYPGPILPVPFETSPQTAALLAQLRTSDGDREEATIQFVTAYSVAMSSEEYIASEKRKPWKLRKSEAYQAAPILCPFWLPEWAPTLEGILGRTALQPYIARLDAFFSEVEEELIRPKLVIRVVGEASRLWEIAKNDQKDWASLLSEQEFLAVCSAIEAFEKIPSHMPTLVLESSDPKMLKEEIQIATEAMKPVQILH